MNWQKRNMEENRPGHKTVMDQSRDDFLMDFENALLENWRKEIPFGPRRFENDEWAKRVKASVYPNHSDVDWVEYCLWVSEGNGDEWFVKGEESEVLVEYNMGWWIFVEDATLHGRFCHECGDFKIWENFYKLTHGRNGRHSICKKCHIFNNKLCRQCKRDHPVPDACEECGAQGKLECDHDHETGRFNKYMCLSCNRNNRQFIGQQF